MIDEETLSRIEKLVNGGDAGYVILAREDAVALVEEARRSQVPDVYWLGRFDEVTRERDEAVRQLNELRSQIVVIGTQRGSWFVLARDPGASREGE